jgi:hypothetical protein
MQRVIKVELRLENSSYIQEQSIVMSVL